MEKPCYLQAITENNSPRYDWGPKKKVNHYGLYAHLNQLESKADHVLNQIRGTTTKQGVNPTDDIYDGQF